MKESMSSSEGALAGISASKNYMRDVKLFGFVVIPVFCLFYSYLFLSKQFYLFLFFLVMPFIAFFFYVKGMIDAHDLETEENNELRKERNFWVGEIQRLREELGIR